MPPSDSPVPNNAEARYASTLQVAKALGLSVTTVKRWVDEGILPAHRTVGGHRKLLMADVIRLARQGNLPQADLSQLLPEPLEVDLTDPAAIRDQLIVAVEKLDAELVRTLIQGAYHRGYPIEVLADLAIAPAMHYVGHQWEKGKMPIAHEHRATQAIVSALYELKSQLRIQVDRERPVAIGGAPEGDHSILASLLAKLVLLDSGWNAINLGPHTPMIAFIDAVDELNPQLVWISVSHLDDVETFLRNYAEFYKYANKKGIAVAVGGYGLTEAIRSKMPYTTYGDGLSHLASFAKMLHRLPSRPRRGRPGN